MAEILSRSEVELLLSALDAKPLPADIPRESHSGAEAGGSVSERSSELARAAVAFCEPFRLAWQATLQQMLNPAAVVRRHMPARTSLQEYLQDSAERPVWFVLETERSPGGLLLAADRGFLVHLLYGLLGAETKPGPEDIDRPWTDLERRLWQRVLRHCCESLPPSIQWPLSGVEIVEAPSEFSHWNAQSAWWVERWELRAGELRGGLRFAAPWEELSRRREPSPVESTSGQELTSNKSELVAELARVEISPGELAELKPGDVIVTDRDADAPIRVLIDGEDAFTGLPGLHDGRKAVQLQVQAEAESKNRQDDE